MNNKLVMYPWLENLDKPDFSKMFHSECPDVNEMMLATIFPDITPPHDAALAYVQAITYCLRKIETLPETKQMSYINALEKLSEWGRRNYELLAK